MKKEKNSKFFVGSVITVLLLLGLVKVILMSMQHLEASEISQTPTPAAKTTTK